MTEKRLSLLAEFCLWMLWLPHTLLSYLVDGVLRIKYWGEHSSSRRTIPSTRFVWPNGQGTEKFFDGGKAALKWRQQLGPVYRIWDGMSPEIVLTKPHHLQSYFRNSHAHVKSKDNNAGWLFHEILGNCVGVVSLDQWRNLRKVVEEPFTRPAAMGYTATILSNVRQFMAPLLEPSAQAQTLDPVNDIKSCAFFVVAEIFFGQLSPTQRITLSELGTLRDDLFKHAFTGGINRYRCLRYCPGSAHGDLQRFQRRWETFVLDGYSQAQQQPYSAAPIIDMWNGVTQGKISKVECLQTLDESLFANLDVTAIEVSWVLIHLAQHPQVQEAVWKEFKLVREDDTQYREYLNRDDTLLAWCVLESARLKPILPFSNPESATTDHIIDGYTIPRNVDVVVDTHAINVANPFWGPNSANYDPYRFRTTNKSHLRYNMWRFGVGPRQCLGKHVADRLLRTIAAEMVASFELRREDDTASCVKDGSWIGLPNIKLNISRRL
ncbi:hypothetical protein BBP40_000616 [Aspergillus hancockii]|nr:hypothetical protein BBP40_000616 [Aspergillus hancockii]